MRAYVKGAVFLGFLLFMIATAIRPVLAAPFAYITNDGSNTVSVINLATNAVTATIPVGSHPRGVAVSPSGIRVYVANYGSHDVSVIDSAANAVITTIPVTPAPDRMSESGIKTLPQDLPLSPPSPMGIAINPSGTKVYVANTLSGHVTVIDATTHTVIGSVMSGSMPYGVAVHPAGHRVYVTNSGEGTVSVIDAESHSVLTQIPVKNQPYGVAVTPDGSKVYVANYGDSPMSTVSVIDTASNTVITDVEVTSLSTGSAPYGLAVNPAGTKVYVTNYAGGYVAIIDTATDTWTDAITVGNQPVGLSLSHDGARLYVAMQGKNTVSVIDTETKLVLTEVPVGTAPYAFGQFVAQGFLWKASISFSIKFTYPNEDASGNIKFQNLNQTFTGRIGFFESDLTPKQITFISEDGTVAGYFRTLASILTNTPAKSETLLVVGTGDFSYFLFGEQGKGIAYIDAKGTLKEGSSGAITSISLSGKIGGGVDQGAVFSGSFRATLTL